MTNQEIIPIILCGGSGTRLWPLSRESYPKQYLSLIKNSKYSLLQNTIKRINNVKNIVPPLIILSMISDLAFAMPNKFLKFFM